VIIGDGGDIEIIGDGGFDRICSGAGEDQIVTLIPPPARHAAIFVDGGSGFDDIQAANAGEVLVDRDGPDWIRGSGGNDHLAGDGGNDHLFGDDGAATLLPRAASAPTGTAAPKGTPPPTAPSTATDRVARTRAAKPSASAWGRPASW